MTKLSIRARRLAWGTIVLLALFVLAAAPVLAQTTDPGPLDELGLALALTAAGATVVASVITGIVEILSRTIGFINGKEQGLALVLAGLVVVAAITDAITKQTMVLDLTTIFAGVIAWYNIARVSMAIHDDVVSRNPQTSLGGSIANG